MIRNDATQRQVDAADPKSSTWLSANAGSGKTRVLTDRVARLLFDGVEPQNILCLTYTKAAAAEMQNRLFKRLGAWAMMDNDALRRDLIELGTEGSIDNTRLANARQLFARAIETPGGLKIQTIHSFCGGVLRRFPLEAGISPQFREMEDGTARDLRAEVVDDMIMGDHAALVDDLLRYFSGADLADLTADITRQREILSVRPSDEVLRNTLDLTPDVTRASLLKTIFMVGATETLTNLIPALRKGSTTDAKAADALAQIDLSNPPRLSDAIILEDVFLFKSGKTPFTAKLTSFPTKATREANLELIEDLHPIMEAVEACRQDRLALVTYERTRALHAFSAVFLPAYEQRKINMGLLDFDDLIVKTKLLLTDEKVAAWVLFRLDGGIDHVLVDEAQDTSPNQWAVIRQLTHEFTAGVGANPDNVRTIFVVGDRKQSIYSFQGAAPEAFDQMRHHFDDALTHVGRSLANRQLNYSFRSSPAILRVVDETFVGPKNIDPETDAKHLAFKADMPGRVDLWPVIEKTEVEDPKDWFAPVDQPSQTNEIVVLANQIASQIKHMITHDTLPVEIENSGVYNHRPITEGDILILVRGRKTGLFSEIIRACKAAELQIAGADRLRVGAELAVRDLVALLSFLALPEDDLSLACALKSPLFGWSEQDLFTLAHHRPEKGYLWSALRHAEHHAETLAILLDLRKQADFLRPYDLIERILTRHQGRENLLARIGIEAEDGIDALLSQALIYESNGVPSLTGFLAAMQTDDLEVKRQMDNQGDRIRVMTVHGAKGLEAPIVILPDCAKKNAPTVDDLVPANGQIIWRPNADASSDSVTAMTDPIKVALEEERLRLLYVAMTRAEKWLIVAAAGDTGKTDDSWYNMISGGMDHAGAVDADSFGLPIKRFAFENWASGTLQPRRTPDLTVTTRPTFGDLPEIITPKTISPSDLKGAKILLGDPSKMDEDNAMARGTAIHLLLEHLPLAPISDREKLAKALLSSMDAGLADDTEILDHVTLVLNEPNLEHLWTNDALTEVDISAQVDTTRFHGAIDRLLITDKTVLAIDYKSNHLTPTTPDKTPEGLLRQMGAYQAALAKVFPDHSIEVAILWTKTATLMPMPPKLILDALERATTP
ncbi:double-strand break repair helicase AddA [Yoonia sp. MH D7]